MSPGSRINFQENEAYRISARKPLLRLRARTLQALRSFFVEREYLEVETPTLIPAPAPERHIEAIPAGTLFLRTSPELCMKRLLAAGYPRLFQIAKCFREGERGSSHLPEFTLLEWYRAGADYRDLMGECEALFCYLADRLATGPNVCYQGRTVDLTPPWHRITVREAFERFAPVSLQKALETDRFDEHMALDIEPRLGAPKPAILYDYPACLAALSRLKPNDPAVAERFELYVGAGMELANAFSELTDAPQQEQRFKEEAKERQALGKRTYPLPRAFLKALPRMPPAAGIALGVDRLVMFFGDRARIDEVVSFTPEEL